MVDGSIRMIEVINEMFINFILSGGVIYVINIVINGVNVMYKLLECLAVVGVRSVINFKVGVK